MTPDSEPIPLDYQQHERRRMAVQIAVLEQQVKTRARDMTELKETNRRQSEKLDLIFDKLSEARGGWRTLMALGGAAATIGSAVTWLLTHIRVSP